MRLRTTTRRLLVLAAALTILAACSDADAGVSTAAAAAVTSPADPTTAAATSTSASPTTAAAEDGLPAAGVITIRMATVADPGNAAVGVVSVFGGQQQFVEPPADGGIYTDCG